ncbi:hypothetical protein HDU81_004599 [Chytriomyces hyalinus]|nr:hypothetical protein HDU81_004599 [Chytriomyces hyalinus]
MFNRFVTTPLSALLDGNTGQVSPPAAKPLLELAVEQANKVPSYASFNITEFSKAPFLEKKHLAQAAQLNADPFLARCTNGQPPEIIHVSSGSGGVPTFWGRSVSDEVAIATRFEQIFVDAFNVTNNAPTLAIVALPMGSWVGGLFTTSCIRYLSQKGHPVSVIAPGNNVAEILRIVLTLGASFRQIVVLAYPPFAKTCIDAGTAQGIRWSEYSMKFVFAGEVFSEEWRTLISARAGVKNLLQDVVSIYGTADAGVLANETPLSALIRAKLASKPDVARVLFKKDRIPSLMQYDPLSRYFEVEPESGTLVITTMPHADVVVPSFVSMPLLRYSIGDAGGLIGFDEMMEFMKVNTGLDAVSEVEGAGLVIRKLPFVWVFGRAFWTVSLYGANVYVENVMAGLEQEHVHSLVTGKFVLDVSDDPDNVRLLIQVELAAKNSSLAAGDESQRESADAVSMILARSILGELRKLNSEFAHYVPDDKQLPICPMNTSKVRFNNSFSFSDASFDVSRLSLNEAPLESIETQQLKIRQQHLARLLAQTQDTVLKQQTEIAVLRKTLLDYSSSSFISTSMSQADVEPVDARAAEDERILDKVSPSALKPKPHKRSSTQQRLTIQVKSQEKEIASLSASLTDSRKTIDSLKSQLCLKDATIDSLTTALDKSTKEAFTLKDQSARLKKELDESRQELLEQKNSLVETMLTRASASPVREPIKSNRGRKQTSSRAREDTISSTQKKMAKTLSPSNLKPQFRNRGHHHVSTTTSEHQKTSPSVWKRARSYDASLRESVRYEDRLPKVPVKMSKAPIAERRDKIDGGDGLKGWNVPTRVDTSVGGKTGVDQLRWLDLSPFEHGCLLDKKRTMNSTDWNRKPSLNHNSMGKPVNSNAKTAHQEAEFEKLNARAAAAEKERDALEEELLNLLTLFNQNKMAT